MVKKKQRDWFAILRDLMAAGVSMRRVGRACGRDVGTVQHWAEGGEPKDSDARVVLVLYRLHCPDAYRAHMEEFEAEVLAMQRALAWLRPHRPARRRARRPGRFDFFVEPGVA